MEVVYIDASECPRKVMGSFSSATSQVLWIYLGAIFLVTPAAIVASSMSAATPLWIQIALAAAFVGALLLPFVALALQDRALKSSGLVVQPYGVTLRRILRSLASFRRSLDRASGWSRRRIVVLAALVRLAAVAIAVASVASGPLAGLPKNVAGPLLLGGLALAAVLWIVVAGRLLRPKRTDARLLARTTLRRVAAAAVFLAVAFACVSAFGTRAPLLGRPTALVHRHRYSLRRWRGRRCRLRLHVGRMGACESRTAPRHRRSAALGQAASGTAAAVVP